MSREVQAAALSPAWLLRKEEAGEGSDAPTASARSGRTVVDTAGCSTVHLLLYHLHNCYHAHVPPGRNLLNNFLSIASPFKNVNLILSNNSNTITLGVCGQDQCLLHKNHSPFLAYGRTPDLFARPQG